MQHCFKDHLRSPSQVEIRTSSSPLALQLSRRASASSLWGGNRFLLQCGTRGHKSESLIATVLFFLLAARAARHSDSLRVWKKASGEGLWNCGCGGRAAGLMSLAAASEHRVAQVGECSGLCRPDRLRAWRNAWCASCFTVRRGRCLSAQRTCGPPAAPRRVPHAHPHNHPHTHLTHAHLHTHAWVTNKHTHTHTWVARTSTHRLMHTHERTHTHTHLFSLSLSLPCLSRSSIHHHSPTSQTITLLRREGEQGRLSASTRGGPPFCRSQVGGFAWVWVCGWVCAGVWVDVCWCGRGCGRGRVGGWGWCGVGVDVGVCGWCGWDVGLCVRAALCMRDERESACVCERMCVRV